MRRFSRLAIMLMALAGSACASVERSAPDRFRGTSGPVAWEAVNVRQRVTPGPPHEIRWDYTLVLKETSGTGIQFEKVQSQRVVPFGGESSREDSFRRRLGPRGELRLNAWESIGERASGAPAQSTFSAARWQPDARWSKIVTLRYSGLDDAGKPAVVEVRLRFDPSVGTVAESQALAVASPRPGGRTDQLERAVRLETEARQLFRDGRYTEALPKAQEALAIREADLGPRHLAVAESLNTIAELHRVLGRFDEAARLHRRALGLRQEMLPSGHPEVAQSLNNLAMLHHAQARYDEAQRLLDQAQTSLERAQAHVVRNNHLHAEILENLAKVYRALGKVREAEEADARAAILWTMQ